MDGPSVRGEGDMSRRSTSAGSSIPEARTRPEAQRVRPATDIVEMRMAYMHE
jgi:hypothetical protein